MLKKSSLGALRFLYRFAISPALDTLAWAQRSWLATVGLTLLLTVGTAYLALLLMAHNAYAGWAEPAPFDAHASQARHDEPAVAPAANEPVIAPYDLSARRHAAPDSLPKDTFGTLAPNAEGAAKVRSLTID